MIELQRFFRTLQRVSADLGSSIMNIEFFVPVEPGAVIKAYLIVQEGRRESQHERTNHTVRIAMMQQRENCVHSAAPGQCINKTVRFHVVYHRDFYCSGGQRGGTW